MTTNNSFTSEDLNPKPEKKAPAKKAPAKKAAPKVEKESQDSKVEETFILVYESGAGYVTQSGFKFTRQNNIAELPYEEAMRLLSLDNFKRPTDEEKEAYYNSIGE